jgi:hypothetical protein
LIVGALSVTTVCVVIALRVDGEGRNIIVIGENVDTVALDLRAPYSPDSESYVTTLSDT